MSDEIPLSTQNAYPGNEQQYSVQAPSTQLFGQQPQSQPTAFQFGQVPFGKNQIESESSQLQNTQLHFSQLQEALNEPAPNKNEGHSSLEEMEQEAARLRELNAQLDSLQPQQEQSELPKSDADSKSIYVGNVDYEVTPLELQQHFSGCGSVERVTILSNKQTGQPKGFAYLEFLLQAEADTAVATMNGSILRDRELKVSFKRANVPAFMISGRGGFRGRGRGRGMMRGRGRGGFRGRGAMRGGPRFSPY
ncbi:RNA recognition RRM, RBD, or RNP domain [Metschnikowia aff. pulcherrima]|uniref:RNA recognition RRM, RBD, or RNP domain n=1 Tax=Metschnikowia aff. pulcherrima TaxID=2163413 RepID=A0A4P6XDZ8_9ASCO|nr:RNA recognition RRM, RBD, or RNP domain [Metschnikowia aff. pulcherrima]